MFFPLDTIKTRVQSSQGFWNSGGFKGVYRGVGSVGLGSAPGGKSIGRDSADSLKCLVEIADSSAAAFFVTYEALKKQAPKLSSSLTSSSSMTHLLAATGGEFVRPS
jgi:solute carrier family 25 S-adenosylmethionine transporter 26